MQTMSTARINERAIPGPSSRSRIISSPSKAPATELGRFAALIASTQPMIVAGVLTASAIVGAVGFAHWTISAHDREVARYQADKLSWMAGLKTSHLAPSAVIFTMSNTSREALRQQAATAFATRPTSDLSWTPPLFAQISTEMEKTASARRDQVERMVAAISDGEAEQARSIRREIASSREADSALATVASALMSYSSPDVPAFREMAGMSEALTTLDLAADKLAMAAEDDGLMGIATQYAQKVLHDTSDLAPPSGPRR